MSGVLGKASSSIGGMFSKKRGSTSTQTSKKTSLTGTESPYFTDTGYSNIRGSRISLDPSIRALQDSSLQNYASIYGDVGRATDQYVTGLSTLRGKYFNPGGTFDSLSDEARAATGGFVQNVGDIRSKYLGNEGALMQARVNPVIQARERLRADTQQNLGSRGLGGSSFYGLSMRNIDLDSAREEADARALATDESLRANLGLSEAELTARRGGVEQLAGLSDQAIKTQLGLSDAELNAVNTQAQQRAQLTGETLEVAKARLLHELELFKLGARKSGTGEETGQETGKSKETGFGLGINLSL